MATVTPNFNWPVPTSTDLVKDGATAMEALGDAIDTSMVDLKGGTTGQVLAKASNTDMDFSWVAQDDNNAIQNSIVDAKGDLIAASAADTPARLAVGSNGETLVADSSTATGLKWQAPNGPAFSARVNTNQTITANTFVKVQLNNEYFDTDNCFDSTTNYRFTPTKAGIYYVSATLASASSSPTRLISQLYKNGSGYLRWSDNQGSTLEPAVTGSTLVSMNGTTDYLELYAYSATINGTLQAFTGGAGTVFSGTWIRSN